MHMKEIGERLCALRLALGLTQEQVAAAIFTSRANYAKMESGDRDIKTEHCIALAEFFDVPCDYLLRGVNTENLTLSSELGLTDAAIEHLKALASSKDWHDHDTLLSINMLLYGEMDNVLEAIYTYIHADFSMPTVYNNAKAGQKNVDQVYNRVAFKSPPHSANPTGHFQFPVDKTFEDSFQSFVLRLLQAHRNKQQRSRAIPFGDALRDMAVDAAQGAEILKNNDASTTDP